MFQEERLYKILELLQEKESLTTTDIVENFGVSRDTARRDIVKLTNEGSVLRTHGGITLPKLPRAALYYNERINENVETKQRIAQAGVPLLRPGQICFFDASTTIFHLCKYCPLGIEVFSNSLNNLQALDQREITVHITGGTLNHQNKFIYGYETVEQIRNIHFDIAFLGADGVREDGFYSYKPEDAAIKRAVCEMAHFIYIMTDSKKFYESRPYKCCSFKEIDGVITDDNPPEEYRNLLEKNNVQLILAK